jgi:hypothetical protein
LILFPVNFIKIKMASSSTENAAPNSQCEEKKSLHFIVTDTVPSPSKFISERIVDETEPMLRGMVKVPPVTERFTFSYEDEQAIRNTPYKFGYDGLSDSVYYNAYSQLLQNGQKEKFPDTIIRVVTGVMSIRKNWYINHGIAWDEKKWNDIALRMGKAFMKCSALPPGRGLFSCGTNYMYERGAAALNNCGFISTSPNLSNAVSWLADLLMCGAGVGYDLRFDDVNSIRLPGCEKCRFQAKCEEKDGKTITCTADPFSTAFTASPTSIVIPSPVFGPASSVTPPPTYTVNQPLVVSPASSTSSITPPPTYSTTSSITPPSSISKSTDGCNHAVLTYVVHDSREGWVKSIQLLIDSYLPINPEDTRVVHFDYTAIRAKGVQIKGFGGISSGYMALEKVHNEIRSFFECFFESTTLGIIPATINLCRRTSQEYLIEKIEQIDRIHKFLEEIINNPVSIGESNNNSNDTTSINSNRSLSEEDIKVVGCNPFSVSIEKQRRLLQDFTKSYGKSRLIADIMNATGVAIISGNVRRGSQLCLGSAGDIEFLNLKNYQLNPERLCIGWMSNNSVMMEKTEDFEYLPGIAERIRDNGEPGIVNLINIRRYGRVGNYSNIGRESEQDNAIGINPCGEIPLEGEGELCNLVDIHSGRCSNYEELAEAAYLACIFASTVSLLPTHWAKTNAIINRNRRIGVSFGGIADYHDLHRFTKLTKDLKALYKVVRRTNTELALEAGVNFAIRVSTVKPNGNTGILCSGSPGAHFPCFRYSIRRIRIAANSDLVPILHAAGYESEVDSYSGEGTLVFSFPIDQTGGGTTRPATEVSLREQAMLLQSLARIYADNSISQTLYFNPELESRDIENVLAQTCPLVKSLSMLPHTSKGVYKQSPYEEITQTEYHAMKKNLRPINWSNFKSLPIMSRGCESENCDLNAFKIATSFSKLAI